MAGGNRRILVTFHGVRGSTPCDGDQYRRYGGQSSCVVVESNGEPPIVLDLGTGLRTFGEELIARDRGPFHGAVLLSHLHWDHVQGLPFFRPLHDPEATLDVYGPRQDDQALDEAFEGLMRPPYFPIRPSDLPGEVRFQDVGHDQFTVGSARVRSRWVRHTGPTLGFRIDWGGRSVAYISDHGQGSDTELSDDHVPDEVLELCDGVDLLVHDAQHTREEFEPKRHWGHCTVDYAVHVAKEAGARRLALFHHDPAHGDDDLDAIGLRMADLSAHIDGAEVFAASEGRQVELPHPGTTGAGAVPELAPLAEEVPTANGHRVLDASVASQ